MPFPYSRHNQDPIMEFLVDGVLQKRTYTINIIDGLSFIEPNHSHNEMVCQMAFRNPIIVTTGE